MDTLHIITASHIADRSIRLDLLYKLIESIRFARESFSIKHHISMFVENADDNMYHLHRIYDSSTNNYNICLKITEEAHTRVEHLDLIFKSYKFEDDSIIMFMDDDDMLLQFPSTLQDLVENKIRGFAGKQIIPIVDDSDDNWFKLTYGSILDICKIIKEGKATQLRETDCNFCGYCGKYSDIRVYFDKRQQYLDKWSKRYKPKILEEIDEVLAHLESTQLTNYCHSLEYVEPDEAFIYHRLLPEEDKSRIDESECLLLTKDIVSRLNYYMQEICQGTKKC